MGGGVIPNATTVPIFPGGGVAEEGGWGLKNYPRDADIFLPRPEGRRKKGKLLAKWPDHFDPFESLVRRYVCDRPSLGS